MQPLSADTPLERVLGGKSAQALRRAFEYETVQDLLEHYPRRYEQRGELTTFSQFQTDAEVTVIAQVEHASLRQMRGRKGNILEVRVSDGEGRFLNLTFFNQAWRQKYLRPGVRGQFAGKLRLYRGQMQLMHPDYELFEVSDELEPEEAERLQVELAKLYANELLPIYPATASVPSWSIMRMIDLILRHGVDLPEILPHGDYLPYAEAIRAIHRPTSQEEITQASQALSMCEAFSLQLSLQYRRNLLKSHSSIARPKREDALLARFDALLPYSLTADQQHVAEEIERELALEQPMNRLLQGEVGSGKTVVALRAMMQVADSGGQSVLLAPTEVLASQHVRSLRELLGLELAGEVQLTLLTGKLSTEERKRAMLNAVSGKAKIIVGTHALLSEGTEFYDLGLVIIDEQHRFGVEQRETLRQKSRHLPHTLAMTATPIPRTIALTAFGDFDISTIRTLPAGRQSIDTHVVEPKFFHRVWERVLEEIAQQRSVYIVCPAISAEGAAEAKKATNRSRGKQEKTGETLPPYRDCDPYDLAGRRKKLGNASFDCSLANVEDVAALLADRADFSHVKIATLTGSMNRAEKEQSMQSFEAGESQLLVSTTVVEVGVNVPRATVMIVLDAERFGISQLHQLRGRIGRGTLPGICLLLTRSRPGSAAHARLRAVAATRDGFELAQKDLEFRREGDILGTVQSGRKSTLKKLSVLSDKQVIVRAREWVDEIFAKDPHLQKHPHLFALAEREQNLVDRLAKN